ncbi:HNH endonuclease [Streptomyces sp. NPDC094461]|uniref:HNH endonuclease n=1 Tax=Streptomyces sp. NPDC094461 TaxID=3366064 RepID=UPI00382F26CC
MACEACGFDFEALYGDRGAGHLECYHAVPLHEAGQGRSKLSDLALICANCHRMIHRRAPWSAPAELRVTIEQRRTSLPRDSVNIVQQRNRTSEAHDDELRTRVDHHYSVMRYGTPHASLPQMPSLRLRSCSGGGLYRRVRAKLCGSTTAVGSVVEPSGHGQTTRRPTRMVAVQQRGLLPNQQCSP